MGGRGKEGKGREDRLRVAGKQRTEKYSPPLSKMRARKTGTPENQGNKNQRKIQPLCPDSRPGCGRRATRGCAKRAASIAGPRHITRKGVNTRPMMLYDPEHFGQSRLRDGGGAAWRALHEEELRPLMERNNARKLDEEQETE